MKYKLGKTIWTEDNCGDFQWKSNVTTNTMTFRELLEMGAQLIEEEKPQEIEELDLNLLSNTNWSIDELINLQAKKINEITKAFNTHLSACGKEKHV